MKRCYALRRLAVRFVWLIVGIVVAGSGCTRSRPEPDLGKIYNVAAQAPDYLRNPVIVIPGLMGSRLIDEESGQVVWGEIGRKAANPRTREGIQLAALPMAEGVPLRNLRDSLRSDGPLDYLDINVAGVPIQYGAYAQILASLGVGGYRDSHGATGNNVDYGDQHFTCFQFDYDWRRDISELAEQLHRFILSRRKYVMDEMHRRYGFVDPNLRFDIVAHSMGGLIARYYLRYGGRPLPDDGSLSPVTWEGSRFVRQAVLVAPPNFGSVLAFKELLEGTKLAAVLPSYQPAIGGTYPSTYQLLPRPRHSRIVDAADPSQPLDVYSPALWRQAKLGLASPAQDPVLQVILPNTPDREHRLRIALDHQRKCLLRARQFHAALDVAATPPPHLTVHLFAGDAIESDAVIALDTKTGKAEVVGRRAGDGTVTRASALADERTGETAAVVFRSPIRWTSKTFLPTDHMGLTRDPVFVDNVLSLLLESPQSFHQAVSRHRYSGSAPAAISRLPAP